MKVNDCRDWFIMGACTFFWLCGTVYLFLHPAVPVFATWAGLVTTMGGIYHFITVHDDKVQDIS